MLLRFKLHTVSFYYQYILQLPLPSMYCYMQYAHNWDILLRHNSAPLLLTLYIQSSKIRYEGFILQNSYFPHVMYCGELKS